jgi:alanine dehydrogenase
MLIGVPKEIKTNENRIALAPAGAEALGPGGTQRPRRAGSGAGQRISG